MLFFGRQHANPSVRWTKIILHRGQYVLLGEVVLCCLESLLHSAGRQEEVCHTLILFLLKDQSESARRLCERGSCARIGPQLRVLLCPHWLLFLLHCGVFSNCKTDSKNHNHARCKDADGIYLRPCRLLTRSNAGLLFSWQIPLKMSFLDWYGEQDFFDDVLETRKKMTWSNCGDLWCSTLHLNPIFFVSVFQTT